jgi:hypothetical protein
MINSLTLFGGEEPQIICCASVERVALPIVPILENDTEAIELFHKNLNNYANQLVTVLQQQHYGP